MDDFGLQWKGQSMDRVTDIQEVVDTWDEEILGLKLLSVVDRGICGHRQGYHSSSSWVPGKET